MILYGSDISPFTRRVAIWCALQGRAIERRPLRAMGEGWAEIRRHNPVGRVPILVLDDDTELIESWAICDWLEDTAPADRRLLPVTGVARRDCLQLLALANATAEKAVAMVYERNRRPQALHWNDWQDRLTTQIRGGLVALDAALPEQGFHGGERPDGADIGAVLTHDFVADTNPWLLEPGYPRLAALATRARALAPFAETMPNAG